MPRPPAPDDLYRFRIPTDPRLSPDGAWASFTVQMVAPRRDGYRHSIWLAATRAEAAPRQLTLGAKHDRSGRFSPDGRTLAFLSDRRAAFEDDGRSSPTGPSAGDREDLVQVYLLPLDGGEARRLTDLPLGVDGFDWSPDGRRLLAWSASREVREEGSGRTASGAAAAAEGPPDSDYHFVDRLTYLFNGRGYVYHRRSRLWLVDVQTGAATRLTDGATDDLRAAWSPDGLRIAFAANRRPDSDLVEHLSVFVLDVATKAVTQVTGGDQTYFSAPAWLPDGATLAVIGHRFEAAAGSRSDVWLFPADGSANGPDGGRNLTARHDRMTAAGLASDLTPNEEPRIVPSVDGAWLTVLTPDAGAYDLVRIAAGDGRLEQLTRGRHVVTGFDQVDLPGGQSRIAYVQSDPTHPSEVHVLDLDRRGRPAGEPRRLTHLNDDALAELDTVEPQERWTEVDGRRIQGWFFPPAPPAASARPAAPAQPTAPPRPAPPARRLPPLVTQIHGGPHSFYTWAPTWEFQVLAGAGMAVFASNPRGSDGYGQDFNAANHRDWAEGPMRDVLAGIDALVADGLVDPDRLGVTGGSYGGYLTNWIIAHDQRFRAALTARSVSDMTMLMLTGDISGGEFGRLEFDVAPWQDFDYYREISPLTYAANIHTPLLIQHSEKDLRTTIGQAEALFTVLRSLGRLVRLMRVPEETHELTRSGTPFRRVENLVQVRDWFAHFLLRGRRSLPPVPKVHGGR